MKSASSEPVLQQPPPTPVPLTRLLDGIRSPEDVKRLPEDQLGQLAQEIRDDLIYAMSESNPKSVGGHLGPNLGVVELTIALHRVFSTPKDRILFDVSHQVYVHKMLTGRADRIHTIRQYEGLNGFMLRTESEHDCYGAGHAGTALSAGLGMAAARDLKGTDESVVVVAGDAAFTCGVSFEALNNVAETTKKFIVVLNDNEWSIARNVGSIATYLNKIATNPMYQHVHDKAARFIEGIAGRGALELAHRVESGVKNLILPSVLFEDFGMRYYGPIDGHDTHALIRTFEFLKTQNEPVLLHIMTKKGKGYGPAVAQPDKFHGLGKYNQSTGETAKATQVTYSEILGKTLADFADTDKTITTITGAMPTGTGLIHFQKRHPKQYFDVGIAEEHAALFACGHAVQGLRPFLTIYSTFMQRAYDMIIHDIALQNLPVRLCMDRAGLSGDDGPTHHGLFDIAYLRGVPGITFMSPKDEEEFADMLWTMANYDKGPIAIRYPRGAGTGAKPKEKPQTLEIGKSEVLRQGKRVALFALGNMCEVALKAADLLEKEGVSTAVINARWIKPLDTDTLEIFAGGVEVLATLEDHVLANGYGCAVMEHLSEKRINVPVVRVGWPDEFIEHGTIPVLRKKHGLTAEALVERVKAELKK